MDLLLQIFKIKDILNNVSQTLFVAITPYSGDLIPYEVGLRKLFTLNIKFVDGDCCIFYLELIIWKFAAENYRTWPLMNVYLHFGCRAIFRTFVLFLKPQPIL